jgi:hypothetical protein
MFRQRSTEAIKQKARRGELIRTVAIRYRMESCRCTALTEPLRRARSGGRRTHPLKSISEWRPSRRARKWERAPGAQEV